MRHSAPLGSAAWEDAVERIAAATLDLHRAAVPPRTANSLRVSVTTAVFEMGEQA